MESIKQVTSVFGCNSQGSGNQSPTCSKFTRVAAGVGFASLAIVSWKFIAAGALAYSAYQGGQYLRERYFQRRDAKKDPEVADVAEERRAVEPLDAGHDAHGDQQDRPHQEGIVEQTYEEYVEELKEMQASAKSNKTKQVYEVLITHPKLSEKYRDIHWVGKIVKKHGVWSNRTFGLSSYLVQAFRKIQSCSLPETKGLSQ